MNHYNKAPPDSFLAHHGIKGQKWGVRRFQKENGSYTEAGKRRYNPDVSGAKDKLREAKAEEKAASQAYNKATNNGMTSNPKAEAALWRAVKKTDLAKKDVETEKVKEKLNAETKKSKHRLKLEQEYRDKGYSEQEAEIQAYKRAKTEKVLAVTAGLTIAAVAAYAAYRYHDANVDKLIPAGTMLQNISTNANKGVADAFYASQTGYDNVLYRGLYGKQLSGNGSKVFETKIDVKSAMKVASEKSATNALSELVKSNPTYAKALERELTDLQRSATFGQLGSKQAAVINKAVSSIQNGKIDKNVYSAMNIGLVDHTSNGAYVSKTFYDTLKSKGYDAIIDLNDKKLGGYGTQKPMIVFNGGTKTAVEKARELGEKEINRNYVFGIADQYTKVLGPQIAAGAAAIGAISAGTSAAKKRQDTKIVNDYRREHPNSELSDTDILRNYHGIK